MPTSRPSHSSPDSPLVLGPTENDTQSPNNHMSPLTNPPENGPILTEQNHAPHMDSSQLLNPQELRVPVQNPPSINTTRSNTPSPSHTNSMGTSPNHLGGSSEFPPATSPIPPGTNLSTDYSSTESLDAASLEHAETLLRIVTPLRFEEEGESSGLEEEEEEEEEERGGGEEEEEEERGGEEEGGATECSSVHVSEWGLEHTLRLQGEDEEGWVGEGGYQEGEESGEMEGDRMEDTLTPADCASAQESGGGETNKPSDTHTSIPTVGNISMSPSHTTESDTGTIQNPDSPFSLSDLCLPTTPQSASQQPVPNSGLSSWWAEALAETQDMDDIDALVEQLDATVAERGRREEQEKVADEGRRREGEGEAVAGGEGSERKAAATARPGLAGEEGGASGVSSLSLTEQQGKSSSIALSPPTTDSIHTKRNRSITSSRESLDSVGRKKDQSARSSRSPSPSTASTGSAPSDKVAYIVQAGRLVRLALQYEREREYEEAFDLFKAAVDVLLNGVQSERGYELFYTSHDYHVSCDMLCQ